MLISVSVVRRETERALQLILGHYPYKIVWVPNSQIGNAPSAGDRNIVIEIPDWLVRQWEKPSEEE